MFHSPCSSEIFKLLLSRKLASIISEIAIYHYLVKAHGRVKPFFYLAQQKLDDLEIPAYLELAEKRLEEEDRRANAYLENSTLRPLIRRCEEKFIGNQYLSLVN